jgi:hypothetical protein
MVITQDHFKFAMGQVKPAALRETVVYEWLQPRKDKS